MPLSLSKKASLIAQSEIRARFPGRTSKDKAMFILEKTGVASVPDEAFFHKPGNSQFVRFCFAKEDNELDEACRQLEALGS